MNTLDLLLSEIGVNRPAELLLSLTSSLDLEDDSETALSPTTKELLQEFRASSTFRDRFRLVDHDPLGVGGTATVYLATDSHTGIEVALKTLAHQDATPRSIRRFLREAYSLAALNHPHIPSLLALGVNDSGDLTAAQPRLRLGSLASKRSSLKEQHRFLSAISAAARAAHHAHSRGVLHRDIKPANIGIDDSGVAFLIDWGACGFLGGVAHPFEANNPHRLRDTSLTGANGIVGTLGFIAPERMNGEKASVATEVYALGATVYEIVAGAPPHIARAAPGGKGAPRSFLEIVNEIQTKSPPAIRELAPQIQEDLAAIIERAISRDPGDRYTSSEELADDLDRFLRGVAVKARPRTVAARVASSIAKNPIAHAIVAMLVVLLVAGTIFAARANARAEDASTRLRLWSLRGDLRRTKNALLEARMHVLENPGHLEEAVAAAESLRPRYLSLKARLGELLQNAHPSDDALEAKREVESTLRSRIEFHRWVAREAEDDPQREAEEQKASVAELELAESRAAHVPSAYVASDPMDQLALNQAIEELRLGDEIFDPDKGILEGQSQEYGLGCRLVQDRLRAAGLEDEIRASWKEFEEWLALQPGSFGSLAGRIDLQLDLLFLGLDPVSGSPEFEHVLSRREASGAEGFHFLLRPSLPMPKGVSLDATQTPRVTFHWEQGQTLGPQLASKFECTQDQWLALTGETPSAYALGDQDPRYNKHSSPVTGSHPVENVSHEAVIGVLTSVGLTLPTRRQWLSLAASHANSSGSFSVDDVLARHANIGDEFCAELAAVWAAADWNDGYLVHAPVGTFQPSAAGFFDLYGNVAEMIIGPHDSASLPLVDTSTGATVADRPASTFHILGGDYSSEPTRATRPNGASRVPYPSVNMRTGFRPVRNLTLKNPHSDPKSSR